MDVCTRYLERRRPVQQLSHYQPCSWSSSVQLSPGLPGKVKNLGHSLILSKHTSKCLSHNVQNSDGDANKNNKDCCFGDIFAHKSKLTAMESTFHLFEINPSAAGSRCTPLSTGDLSAIKIQLQGLTKKVSFSEHRWRRTIMMEIHYVKRKWIILVLLSMLSLHEGPFEGC